MSKPHRLIAGLVGLLALAEVLGGAVPASAAGYTGGIAPVLIGGRHDLNGSGGIGGRDDSSAFYGATDVIDGAIDCDAWGPVANAGTPGDRAIDAADDCTLVGVDGTLDGVTIVVEDGLIVTVDGAPVPDGAVMPAVFNAASPTDPNIADADFGWWAFDGRVDANANGAIDDTDCARGVVGATNDVGLGDPADGANIVGASPVCGNLAQRSPSTNGLVDLDGDGEITVADSCDDACFVGQDVVSGFVGGIAGPSIDGFNPTFGSVGTAVTISGTGLTGATEVRFHGVVASIVSNTEVEIVATVPSGATTGPVTVVTPNGQATSRSTFTVTTPPAGGTHERDVSIELRRHLAAAGTVTALDGATACAMGVDVRVQRRIGRRWRTIQAAQTRRNMTYVAILPNFPGKYRAILPNVTLANGDRCASAISPIVRR